MTSHEAKALGPGFISDGGIFIPYLKHPVVVTKMYADEPAQSRNDSIMEGYLVYAVPSSGEDKILPFAAHLKEIIGKASRRGFAKSITLDHSTLSRLLSSDRAPELVTAARIIEGVHLSDAQAYQIVTDSVTVRASSDACRYIYSDNAPALEGSFAEQLKGYRNARNLSQRLLAKKANVNNSTISKLESEERFPTLLDLANLAFVLGLNAQQVRGIVRTAAASRK